MRDQVIVTVVGARPQFIKAAPVSRALEASGTVEVLVHTGQHYDDSLSRVFFEELGLRQPDVNLNVGSGPHGWQTGHMLIGLEEVITRTKPEWVLVYGDTNSTLAAALAAAKWHLCQTASRIRPRNRACQQLTAAGAASSATPLKACGSHAGAVARLLFDQT